MSSITVPLAKFGKALEKQIKDYQKQVRYAAMKAVNEVAFKARNELIDEYPKAFTMRNRNLPKAVAIKKATKENPVAEVSFPKDFMYLNTVGGTKKPENAQKLAFAGDDIDENGGRLSSGKIKPSQKPKQLLKYADEHPTKTAGRKNRKPKAFKTMGKHGYEVIGIREAGSEKRGVKWLYSLQDQAKIEKKWDFDGIVKNVAEKELSKEFDKQLKKALETAK